MVLKKENPTILTYSTNRPLSNASPKILCELGRSHLVVTTYKKLQHRVVKSNNQESMGHKKAD